MNLRKRTVGGIKWTSISAFYSALIQLLQIAILTRFLDRSDFGIMAIALFVIGISTVFVDMGISNAIIHKQKVNKYQLSTLFWLNGVLGFVVFLVVLVFSPIIAAFYEAPELKAVINWVSISFLILPWGQQFEVLLRKDFRFKSLATRDIAAKTGSFFVGVVLAYLGHGVYALVFANLASVSISTALVVFIGLKEKRYRPRVGFYLRSIKGKGFWSFGLFQMGEKLVYYLNSNFDTLIIGKLLGMQSLGLYELAKNLAFRVYLIINPIITKVAFPALARVQNDLLRIKKAYLNIIKTLSSINAPIHVVMILLAEPLVQLIYGSGWTEVVPILQLTLVSALCSSIGNPVGALQLAMGRADWGFYWNLGRFLILPFVIYLGAHYGVIGVAVSLAIFRVVTTFYLSWRLFIGRLIKATYLEYFHSFSKALLLATLSTIPAIALLYGPRLSNFYIEIVVGGGAFALAYLGLNLKFNKSHVIEALDTLDNKSLNKIKKLIK